MPSQISSFAPDGTHWTTLRTAHAGRPRDRKRCRGISDRAPARTRATGAVYLAEDAERRQVALKVLIPELAQNARFRERFLRESQIAAGLDEPHIVPTLAVGSDDGTLYLAMRFIDGRTCSHPQARGSAVPERAVELIRQVAGALDAAHALGLVHRDVKPGNVLVSSTEEPSAPTCATSVSPSTSPRSTASPGSGRSSAHRVHLARADRGRRGRRTRGRLLARVHALECLTGQAPFEREREIATVYAHMNEPPPRPSDVRPGIPEGFDAVIAKALAKAPGDRFGSCVSWPQPVRPLCAAS